MDSALHKIAEIDTTKNKNFIVSTCNDAKELFEEVLCHAMSIAQVALQEDCKIIRGSSQTVTVQNITSVVSYNFLRF